MESEIRQLLAILDQAYNHRSWHGTNLRGSIRGVEVDLASRRPAPGRHNIWELVVHAAYWKYASWRRLTGARRTPDDRPAIELVIEPEQYETELVRTMVERPLAAISWRDTARHWEATWRDQHAEARAALAGLTIATLPRGLRELRALARRGHGEAADHVEDDDIRGWAVGAVGAAVALRLGEAGFELVATPGAPHRLVSGDVAIEPITADAYVKAADHGTLTLHHAGHAPWATGSYAAFVRGGPEGVKTTDAALALGARRNVELPIAMQMAELLAGRTTPTIAVAGLMLRPQRIEAETG